MKIAILAAGAGGMYCGSCMRDNALAAALQRLGHQVTLIPLYTPLRTDAPGSPGNPGTPDASTPGIFYGGINVYLQYLSGIFRHTPRYLDRLWDLPWLLNAAGNWGAQTPPKKLAGLTASILAGDDGPTRKELGRLVTFLKEHVHPQVVSLPNLMFVGMARTIRQALNVPVVCELTGEDIFLEAMSPADQDRIRDLIRRGAAHVARFISTTDYYAAKMAAYLGLPRERIDVVPTGLAPPYFAPPKANVNLGRARFTIGYMARVCPEKGLDRLVDAVLELRKRAGFGETRLVAAGYLGLRDRAWFDRLRRRIDAGPLRDGFHFRGEVDRDQKIDLLDSIDLMSVPTAYPEAKGIYILEALARGVPVVQPAHGSFPELIAQTGGGVLVPPGDASALADAMASLLGDTPRRQQYARAGRAAMESAFTQERMAANTVRIYEALQ